MKRLARGNLLCVFGAGLLLIASACGETSSNRPVEVKCGIVLPDTGEDTIDFGSSATTRALAKKFTIQNDSPRPMDVRLGAFEPNSGIFSLQDASQAEPFTVAAGGAVDVGVLFTPTAAESYQGFLPIEEPSSCNLNGIKLFGKGVEQKLLFDERVEFSYVNPGDTAERELSFQNTGTTPITIRLESLTLVRPLSTKIDQYKPFWIVAVNGVDLGEGETGFGQPVIVPAGRSAVRFRLAFRPGNSPGLAMGEPDYLGITGIHEAVLTLESDEPEFASAEIELHGIGAGPGESCLAATPQTIDFGTVQLGCAASARNVTLVNQCIGKNMALAGTRLVDSHDDVFRIISEPPTGTVLAGGDQMSISLVYRSSEVDSETTSIEVQFVDDDRQTITLSIPVAGKGTPRTQQVDVIQQPPAPKKDLLFVIDNSPSMEPYQQRLADTFQFLITYVANQMLDYHIAVISTDPGDGNGGTPGVVEGAFWPLDGEPSERIVKESMPLEEQKRLISAMVPMGTNGSEVEWLIDPVVKALSPELTREGAHNAGFLREGAPLQVVVISDAHDQAPHSLTRYSDFFNKLTQGIVILHGIIPLYSDDTCVYDDPSDTAIDPRMSKMLTNFHGNVVDICAEDWREMISRLLLNCMMFLDDTFGLAASPNLSKGITVKVEGVEVPEMNGSERAWRYDSSRTEHGAIIFESRYIPRPGATVEITYEMACGGKG